MSDGPARIGLTVKRVVERMRLLKCLTGALEAQAMILIRVSTCMHFRSVHMAAVIAAIDDPLRRLPVTAAVQRTCIAAEPMVPHPPSIDVVLVAAMTVATLVLLISSGYVAMLKILVTILTNATAVRPARLGHDAAEPARSSTLDWTIQVGGLAALACACLLERVGALPIGLEDRRGWCVAMVALAVVEFPLVVLPRRTGVIRTILGRPIRRWKTSLGESVLCDEKQCD